MAETIRAHILGTGIACELYLATIERVRRVAGGYRVATTPGFWRYFVEAKDGKALAGRVGMRVAVTYDLVTEESVQDGDHADHGYIDARTQRRRSYAMGRKRDVESNMRQGRAGKFDFPSLREALRFIDAQNCAHHETCWLGTEDCLSVYCTDAYQGCDVETVRGSRVISVSYALHIQGCSEGTMERIARMLAANGVYFANRTDLQRRRAS